MGLERSVQPPRRLGEAGPAEGPAIKSHPIKAARLPAPRSRRAKPRRAKPKRPGKIGALEGVAVNAVSIRNGTVSYNDVGAGGQALAVTAIDFDGSHFSATGRFDVAGKMAALGSDQNVTLSGEVGPLVNDGKLDAGAIPIDLEATIGPLVLERSRCMELLARSIPWALAISDVVQVKAKITGVADSIKFELSSIEALPASSTMEYWTSPPAFRSGSQ